MWLQWSVHRLKKKKTLSFTTAHTSASYLYLSAAKTLLQCPPASLLVLTAEQTPGWCSSWTVNGPACTHNTNTQNTINTDVWGMQSAWCIIQWPQVGGFSRCCYHNVCARTLLQLFIWIHNEKGPCSRKQKVHSFSQLYWYNKNIISKISFQCKRFRNTILY